MRETIFLAVLLSFVTASYAKPSTEVDLESAWFKPSLTVNMQPEVCEPLLADYIDYYLSDTPVASPFELAPGNIENSRLPIVPWETRRVGREKLHVGEFEVGEEYRAFVWREYFIGWRGPRYDMTYINKPLAEYQNAGVTLDQLFETHAEKLRVPANFASEPKAIYRKGDEVFVVVAANAEGDEPVSRGVLKIREGVAEEVCRIATIPSGPRIDREIAERLRKYSAFQAVLHAMMGESVHCGTRRSHARAKGRLDRAVRRAIVRPWTLDGSGELFDFEVWGYSGRWNYMKYQQFLSLKSLARDELGSFYAEQFNLSGSVAREVAEEAVDGILLKAFNGRISDDCHGLHKAMLSGVSEPDIVREFETSLQKRLEDEASHSRGDSLLTFAVDRPSLLATLLDMGFDVGKANAFGKTPLMYAVQFDKLEAVRVLLEAGADPNAATVDPGYDCEFNLKTIGVTPLHYAVRYASPGVIRALIDGGAAGFANATRKTGYGEQKSESPIVWLWRYANAPGDERNHNIPDVRVDEVADWLAVPSKSEQREMGRRLTLAAERHYRAGDVARAYNELSLALKILPTSKRALSDMSLVALKHGRLKRSLSASMQLIRSDAPRSLKANAWFNQGLACEAYRKSNARGALSFDGKLYCREESVYPFYRALDAQASEGREKKLLEVFADEDVGWLCQIAPEGVALRFHRGGDPDKEERGGAQRVYLLRNGDVNVTPADLAWELNSEGGAQRFTPSLVDSVLVGDKVLELYAHDNGLIREQYVFGDYVCHDGSANAVRGSALPGVIDGQ